MALPNIFTEPVSGAIIERIHALDAETQPQWGKMNASQMLAHCCVSYEMVYENIHPKPGFLVQLILKAFVKNKVVSETPYKRNSQTDPAFLIKESRDFEAEKARLINYIVKTRQLGEAHFDNKKSRGFGVLNKTEWNNMFYKHLDHHLSQFAV
jgi:hypothetical protein